MLCIFVVFKFCIAQCVCRILNSIGFFNESTDSKKVKTRFINQSMDEFAHERKGGVDRGGEISVEGTFSLI